jgi:hypothetical protein
MGLHTDPYRVATQLLSYARAVENAQPAPGKRTSSSRRKAIRTLHDYIRELVTDGWATNMWDIKMILVDHMREVDSKDAGLSDVEKTSVIVELVGNQIKAWQALGKSQWIDRSDRA